MDLKLARLAREEGCKACVFFRTTVTVSGPQHYGSCHVNAPRTSSTQQWPIVMSDRHCGEWLPVSDYRGTD